MVRDNQIKTMPCVSPDRDFQLGLVNALLHHQMSLSAINVNAYGSS